MRAIGFTEFGGPEVFHVFERAEQTPGPGEVRIRVHAATVNPTDTASRAGVRADGMGDAEPPYVVGMEAAGTIDAVGEGAPWSVGDEVMAFVVPYTKHGGTYTQQMIVPANQVVRAPKGLSLIEAATLPMNGLTALLALEILDLPKGATIGITGAAGALGGYLVQLARAAGLRVIGDASETDEELVRSLGAHEVVRRGPEVAERIRAIVPAGVDGLVDGSVQTAEAAAAVADNGAMVSVRLWEGEAGRGITRTQLWVSAHADRQDLLELLRQRVEEGSLTPRVARTYPFEEAADAHRALEAGGIRGRLVLTFD